MSFHFTCLSLSAAIPGGFGLGKTVDTVVKQLNLASVDLILNELAFNIKPFAIRISGGVNLFGHLVSFNVLMTKTVEKKIFALDLSVPGPVIQGAINAILGPIAHVVNPFQINALDFTLSTDEVQLFNYDTIGWNGGRILYLFILRRASKTR